MSGKNTTINFDILLPLVEDIGLLGSTVNNHEKSKLWRKVVTKYNSEVDGDASVDQLSKALRNRASYIKKKRSHNNKELVRTGGGRSYLETIDESEEEFLATLENKTKRFHSKIPDCEELFDDIQTQPKPGCSSDPPADLPGEPTAGSSRPVTRSVSNLLATSHQAARSPAGIINDNIQRTAANILPPNDFLSGSGEDSSSDEDTPLSSMFKRRKAGDGMKGNAGNRMKIKTSQSKKESSPMRTSNKSAKAMPKRKNKDSQSTPVTSSPIRPTIKESMELIWWMRAQKEKKMMEEVSKREEELTLQEKYRTEMLYLELKEKRKNCQI